MERERVVPLPKFEEISAGPISEISLENTVDKETRRLETELGAFAATLKEKPDKARSFFDHLRSKTSLRSVMALLVGLHLAGVSRSESEKPSKPAVVDMTYEEYEGGTEQLFFQEGIAPEDPPVNARSQGEIQSEQAYAPSYEVSAAPKVEKDAEMIEEFMKENRFDRYKVTVIGYSSFEGDEQKNQKLSNDRATFAQAEIQNIFDRAGLDTKNIDWEVQGAGEHVELNGKEVSVSEAYTYLEKALGVKTKAQVDAKIKAFNSGKFDHPALQEVLGEMRGHRVLIEGVGETTPEKNSPGGTFIHESTPPHKVEEEIPQPERKKIPLDEDLILRLRRRRQDTSHLESHGGTEEAGQIIFDDDDWEDPRFRRIGLDHGGALEIQNKVNGPTFDTPQFEKGEFEKLKFEMGTGKKILKREALRLKREAARLEKLRLQQEGAVRDGVVRKGSKKDGGARQHMGKDSMSREDLTREKMVKVPGGKILRDAITIGGKVLRGKEVPHIPLLPVEPVPPVVLVDPPFPPPVQPIPFRRIQGQRREIQSMKLQRPARVPKMKDIDALFQEVGSQAEKPKRKSRPETGRGRVILDEDYNANVKPQRIDYDRGVSRQDEGKSGPVAKKKTRQFDAERKFVAKNETSEPDEFELEEKSEE